MVTPIFYKTQIFTFKKWVSPMSGDTCENVGP